MSSRLEAIRSIKAECCRCQQDKPHAFVLTHYEPVTWGGLEDLPTTARPPEHETVCRDCLTDSEITSLLLPALYFAVTTLLNDVRTSETGRMELRNALGQVQAHIAYQCYIFRSVESHKELALRALDGLKGVPISEIDMSGLYTELSKTLGQKMYLLAHPDDVPTSADALRAFRDKVSIWFSHDPFASHTLRAAIHDSVELFKKYFTRRAA